MEKAPLPIDLNVCAWSAWVQAESEGEAYKKGSVSVSDKPDVSVIPPMLRRRLNLLGRAAASQILALLADGRQAALVYCSRHGDTERTLSVLKELVSDGLVSPMNFSLTVHNAVSGVLSIQTGMTSAVSSIAAGDEGLVPTLLEAKGLLNDGNDYVLCVICDVPVPDIYQQGQIAPQQAFAGAFLLSAKGEGQSLQLSATSAEVTVDQQRPQVLDFIEYLDSASAQLTLSHNHVGWQLQRG